MEGGAVGGMEMGLGSGGDGGRGGMDCGRICGW